MGREGGGDRRLGSAQRARQAAATGISTHAEPAGEALQLSALRLTDERHDVPVAAARSAGGRGVGVEGREDPPGSTSCEWSPLHYPDDHSNAHGYQQTVGGAAALGETGGATSDHMQQQWFPTTTAGGGISDADFRGTDGSIDVEDVNDNKIGGGKRLAPLRMPPSAHASAGQLRAHARPLRQLSIDSRSGRVL